MASTLPSAENAMVVQTITDDDEKERLSRSYRELISTLPTEKGSKFYNPMYQYRGFWYHSVAAIEGVMWVQEHFKARNEDTLFASFPKCGTTWLKSLMFAIMNRSRYDFSAHPLLSSNSHELVPSLELYFHRNIPFPDQDTLSSPHLFHTHIPFPSLPQPVIDSQCRIVYICRNPKDVFVSFFFFHQARNPSLSIKEEFEQFCKGVCIAGPFWDHILGYWKASLDSPKRVLFMKYEDLKRDSSFHVKQLAEFIGCPFSPKEESQGLVHEIIKLCSFENLSNLKTNKRGAISAGDDSIRNDTFFRKGEIGDWKNHLAAEMAERLDRIIEEKFKESGLTFSDSSADDQCPINGVMEKTSLESSKRVLFMKYENVKRDSTFHGKELADFIGCPSSLEEESQGLAHEIIKLASFKNLSNLKANKRGAVSVGDGSVRNDTFFRKGEIGDWKNHLTAEMAERLDKIIEEIKFKGTGLTFSDSSADNQLLHIYAAKFPVLWR